MFRYNVKYFRDIEHTVPADTRYILKIHEVAYDLRKKTEIYGFQARPVGVGVESKDFPVCVESLKNELTQMQEAFMFPIIDIETWKELENEFSQ